LRQAPSRLRLHGSDRALLVWITRIWPNLLDLSQVVKPETILRWHRAGFKALRTRDRGLGHSKNRDRHPISRFLKDRSDTAHSVSLRQFLQAQVYKSLLNISLPSPCVRHVEFPRRVR
jgi:hypothetical protein